MFSASKAESELVSTINFFQSNSEVKFLRGYKKSVLKLSILGLGKTRRTIAHKHMTMRVYDGNILIF